MQSMPASIRPGRASVPNVCAVTRAPSSCAAAIAAVQRLARPLGRQVARRRGRSSRRPASPSRRRGGPARATSSTSSLGLQLDRRAPGCSGAGRPDVPAGADDPRQVRLVVQGPGVDRRAAVAQRAARPAARSASACSRSPARSSTARRPSRCPTWQCASTRPGQQPAAPADRLGARHRLEGDPAVAHPEVAVLPLGQHDAREVQRGASPARAASSPNWSKRSLVRSGSCWPGGSRGMPPGKPPPGKPPPGMPPGRQRRAPIGRRAGPPLRPCPSCPSSTAPASAGRGPSSTCGPMPGRPMLPGHLAHHLLGLGEPLQQLVDVGDADARSRWRCAPAARR